MKTIFNKNILGGLILGIAAVGMVSCDDYLDITPPSKVSPEGYFNNTDQLKTYLDKYYANYDNWFSTDDTHGGELPSHFGSQNGSPYYDDNATDNNQGTNNRYIKDEWTVPQKDGKWKFDDIRIWNYFINTAKEKYAKGEISGADTDIKHYMGEGYFMRALEYYFRLRTLGDFPIITETSARRPGCADSSITASPSQRGGSLYRGKP